MEPTKKILFLVAHRPGRSPGQRFRFEQYLDYLIQNGFECHISYLIDQQDDQVFYSAGRYVKKARFLVKSLLHRWKDLKSIRAYDIVFLYREAHMLGITWFEKKIKKAGVKMIVDFDDSIWLKDVSNGNRNLSFLKRPEKTKTIVALCDGVIVGNKYLADYARQYNNKIFIIPTTIDTDYYTGHTSERQGEKICIGWTGSSTTLKHFSLAVPVLQKLREKYGDRLIFRLISDKKYTGPLEGLENIPWNKDTEVQDLDQIDIGIMPLPNDDWSKGKCGFKGLQYMALSKAAVLSPVGVNTEIISHGQNGFLADSPEEWEAILSALIEDAALRKSIGQKGRQTIEERFSYRSQRERYLNIYRDLISTAP